MSGVENGIALVRERKMVDALMFITTLENINMTLYIVNEVAVKKME